MLDYARHILDNGLGLVFDRDRYPDLQGYQA